MTISNLQARSVLEYLRAVKFTVGHTGCSVVQAIELTHGREVTKRRGREAVLAAIPDNVVSRTIENYDSMSHTTDTRKTWLNRAIKSMQAARRDAKERERLHA